MPERRTRRADDTGSILRTKNLLIVAYDGGIRDIASQKTLTKSEEARHGPKFTSAVFVMRLKTVSTSTRKTKRDNANRILGIPTHRREKYAPSNSINEFRSDNLERPPLPCPFTASIRQNLDYRILWTLFAVPRKPRQPTRFRRQALWRMRVLREHQMQICAVGIGRPVHEFPRSRGKRPLKHVMSNIGRPIESRRNIIQDLKE